ncbi:MAG: hypothetical protein ACFFCS_06275 [Candidatus Hodarchaeota archaeon]
MVMRRKEPTVASRVIQNSIDIKLENPPEALLASRSDDHVDLWRLEPCSVEKSL